MSCDWHVHCLDCKETHCFSEANHEEALMLFLCRHSDAIAALAEMVEEQHAGRPRIYPDTVTLRTQYGDVDPRWFKRHLGHNIVPIDEYGSVLGRCQKWVTCACGASHLCALDADHEGECRRAPGAV